MVTTLTHEIQNQNEKIDLLTTEIKNIRKESESALIKRSFDDMATTNTSIYAPVNNELIIQEEDTQTITSAEVCSPWIRLRDNLIDCNLQPFIEM